MRSGRYPVLTVRWFVAGTSASLIIVAAYTLGAAVVSGLARVSWASSDLRLISIPGILFLLLSAVSLSGPARKHVRHAWLRLNRFVAGGFCLFLVILDACQRWSVPIAAALVLTSPLAYFSLASMVRTERSGPLMTQLARDAANFANEVIVAPRPSREARELIDRFQALRPDAERRHPELAPLMDAFDLLFGDKYPGETEKANEAFDQNLAASVRHLSEHAQPQSKWPVASLFKARLEWQMSHQGTEVSPLFDAYATLERIAPSGARSPWEGHRDFDRALSELHANTWANVLTSCASNYDKYAAWADATGREVFPPDVLFRAARRKYEFAYEGGNEFTRARAANNRADLELRRLILAAEGDVLSRDPRGDPSSRSGTVLPLRKGELSLREHLAELETSLQSQPLPHTMATHAQISYLLAHSVAGQLRSSAPDPERLLSKE